MTSQIRDITWGAVGKPAVNSKDYSTEPNPWGPWIVLRRMPSEGSKSRYWCRCRLCGFERAMYGCSLRVARTKNYMRCFNCGVIERERRNGDPTTHVP